VRPKFTILDPKGGITVSGDGYIVTQSSATQYLYTLLTPQIFTRSPPAYVKFRINISTHSGNWLPIGVIGNSAPSGSYYNDPTCYAWGGNTRQVYVAGVLSDGHDGFTQLHQGDTVVLQLDTTAHTLKMAITRLAGRVSTITGLKDIPAYWFYVNLGNANDQV